MNIPDLQALHQQLATRRAAQLRWIADQDPTLTRLKQALILERKLQQMDTRALLAFVTELEACFGQGGYASPERSVHVP
jgi:hypothetical protein